MARSKISRNVTLLSLFLLLATTIAPSFLFDSAKAAPPESLTVNGTECRPKLVRIPTAVIAAQQGEFSNVPAVNISASYEDDGDNVFGGYIQTNIALPIRWYAGPLSNTLNDIDSNDYTESIKTDLKDILALGDPGKVLNNGSPTDLDDLAKNTSIAIVFDAVVAGNGDPQKECRQTPNVLFSRPSKPTEFFGTYLGNETFLTATLDPIQKTISLGNPSGVKQVFNVSGDASIFSNPLFDQSASSAAGFCSDSPSGGAYGFCMQANVVDFNTITYRGEQYILQAWKGNQTDRLEYVLDTATSPYASRKAGLGSCPSKPKFRIDNDNAGKINELTTDGDNGTKGFFGQLADLEKVSGSQEIQYVDVGLDCNVPDESGIELHSLQNFLRIAQYFEKDNTVLIIPKNPGSGEKAMAQAYTKSADDPTLFVAKDGTKAGSCTLTKENSSIKFTSDPSATTGADGSYISGYWTFPDPDSSCGAIGANIKVKFTGVESAETLAAALASGSGSGPAAETTEDKDVCGSGGALGWILCPILALLDESTQALEDQIQGFLFVDTNRFDKNDGGSEIYAAWSTFRGLATVIIVIIALMMIFSQAMGEGIFDNYSLKKILPRLIIAGIGIQLSWFMLVELVNIFNILGNGIGGLVLSNFGLERDSNLRELIGGLTSVGSAGDFAAGALFVGLAIAAPFLMGGLFAIAIGVAFAVLTGIITLIVRDMIILLGVITAPIAIAMSVLPGTQKTSKWWWESFEKALMMYPIIMLLLAAGKVVGNLLFKSAILPNGELNMTYVIAGIIAWYIPYFFLPKALQAGGSALGKITGFAGDKTKGMFDKAKGANDNYQKSKKARSLSNAFDQSRDRSGIRSYRKLTDAKTKAGAYLGAGAIGRGTKFERGNLRVKGAQEATQRRIFDEAAAMKALEYKELDVASENAAASMAAKINIGDKTAVVAHLRAAAAGEAGNAQRTAALKQLAILGADQEVRNLLQTGTADQQQSIRDSQTSQWFQSGFKDKAPDLTKGGAPNAFKDFKSDAMVNWSEGTMNAAIADLNRRKSDAVASGNVADIQMADAAWSRFGQAVSQVVADPKLSGRMGNDTLAAIHANNASIMNGLNGAGALGHAPSINRIRQDGTIN